MTFVWSGIIAFLHDARRWVLLLFIAVATIGAAQLVNGAEATDLVGPLYWFSAGYCLSRVNVWLEVR